MGNSCKGTLATSRDHVILDNTHQAQSQSQSVDRPERGDTLVKSPQTSGLQGLIEYPANTIGLGLKVSKASNMAAASAMDDPKTYNETLLINPPEEPKYIKPFDDQQYLNDSHTGRERHSDEALSISIPQNIISMAATPSPGYSNTHIINKCTGNTKSCPNKLEDTVLKTMQCERPTKSVPANVTPVGSQLANLDKSNTRDITPEMVKAEENVICEFISKSNSFEGIETLTLEDEKSPDPSQGDGACSRVLTENVTSQLSLPHEEEDAENKHENGNEICRKSKNEITISHMSHQNLSLKVSVEDQSEHSRNPSSEEAPRALVNLLHSLYYGKRSKYRGGSSVRGKGPVLSGSLRNIPNLQGDRGVLMLGKPETTQTSHNMRSFTGQDNSYIALPSSAVFVRPGSEHSDMVSEAQSNKSPKEEQRLWRNLQIEDGELSPDFETHRDRAWLSHANVSPTYKFPFNIYKERSQTASQSLFPLADYRFDDGAFKNETNPSKASPIGKSRYYSKEKEHKQHGMSLTSSLSMAGHQTKSFSTSEAILPRALPIGLGLCFPAGASLNEVCVNLSSFGLLKNENLKIMNTNHHAVRYQQSQGLGKLVDTNYSGCTRLGMKDPLSTQQIETKHEKIIGRPETSGNFPQTPRGSNQAFHHNKVFKDQHRHSQAVSKLQPNKLSRPISSNIFLHRHAVGQLAVAPSSHSSVTAFLDFHDKCSTHFNSPAERYSHLQNIGALKMPVREKNSGFEIDSKFSDSLLTGHSLLARKINRTNCSNRLIYSRHMNKIY